MAKAYIGAPTEKSVTKQLIATAAIKHEFEEAVSRYGSQRLESSPTRALPSLAARDLLQRRFAAFVVELLESVKAAAAVNHYAARLRHVAELLGQLQHSTFTRMTFYS
jgi:hypothetical protein